MSQPIVIPSFGESITSALIAQWHKKDGDQITKGDTLVSLETDKISNELQAEHSGTLSISVQEGEEVEIGANIGTIAEGAAPAQPSATPAADSNSLDAESPFAIVKPAAETSAAPSKIVQITVPAAGESITSATVAAWTVNSGDQVTKGQTLVISPGSTASAQTDANTS